MSVETIEEFSELFEAEGRGRGHQPQQQGDRAERRALRLPPLQLQPGPPEEGVGRHDGRGLQGRSPGGGGGEGGLMSGIL